MRKILYILGQLTDDDVEWLAVNGARRELPAGSYLTRQGQPVRDISIILDGTADVLIDKDQRKVATLGYGEIVGEISLVDRRPATAAVRACGPLLCLEIPHTVLLQRFERDTAFSSRFYRAIALFMADRMRSTVAQLGQKGDGQDLSDLNDEEMDDEILDKVHLAGQRFEMILKRLGAKI